ncbi:MAG: hypothetical protein HOE90_10715 [Bacteriovoracaceae bacterium]|jgi:polysaccharide biosynthesis protein PelA|nr:hypothetical protein [Bacteriovoracaceae bacterium]
MIKSLAILLLLIAVNVNAAPIKRRILALWDSTEYSTSEYEQTYLHKHFEVVFNHYGYILEYHDLNNGVPRISPIKLKQQYAGIVSWLLDQKQKSPKSYLAWLEQVLELKIPTLVMGELGAFKDQNGKVVRTNIVNRRLRSVGLTFYDLFFENSLLFKTKDNFNKDLVEFERTLVGEINYVRLVQNKKPRAENWLQIEVRGQKIPADVITFSTRFGYVQEGFDIFSDPYNHRTQWRVNPFKLIEKVYGVVDIPIPDTTTLCGNRISYIHIDGDGFINISDIDRKSNSGKIVSEKIVQKYKFPTTASVVVAEIDPNLKGNEVAVSETKKLFSLPYVEAASHTYSHPLSWEKNPSSEEVVSYLGDDHLSHKGTILAYDIPGYDLNYQTEVVSSLEYINKNLVSEGKKTNVLLWSGSCRPPKEALRQSALSGILNMNGGDSRFDRIYNSYSNLSSLYRTVEEYTQVYASNANENIYTNTWEGPYSGFKDVIETFERTESPVRIKPINIYYHFYSGEKIASLKALNDIYRWLDKTDKTMMFASDYIKLISNYQEIKTYKQDVGNYRVENAKYIKTIRFEQDGRYPDYNKSKNIIGHGFYQGSLYLYLGSDDHANIVLSHKPPKQEYIKSCNGWVKEVKKANGKIDTADGVTRESAFLFEIGGRSENR